MGRTDSSLRPWRFAWPIAGSFPAIWSGPMSMWQCMVWRVPARAPTPCTTVFPLTVFRSGVVAGPGLPGPLSVAGPDVVPTSSDVLVRSASPQHTPAFTGVAIRRGGYSGGMSIGQFITSVRSRRNSSPYRGFVKKSPIVSSVWQCRTVNQP